MIANSALVLSGIASDVQEGLARRPRWLSPKLFYDADGSALFEDITELPEYYLTRTERSILEAHAPEMIAAAGEGLELLELGAGTAAKTGILIDAVFRRQLRCVYHPIDVSPDALREADARLQKQFPNLRIKPVVADYTQAMPALATNGHRKLALYLGSSIGNFEPADAVRVLRALRRRLRSGDALLLGTDLRKPRTVLLPAYDDAQGVTARFNLNVLARINRELGADFRLDHFRHVAKWNARQSRVEMHLVSLRAQTVRIPGAALTIHFTRGESIHTENSYKYSRTMIVSLLRDGGFHLERTWTDDRKRFAVHLARA